MATYLLLPRSRPDDDGIAPYCDGAVRFSVELSAVEVEAFDIAGARRWRGSFGMPPSSEMYARGCSHVVIESSLLVFGFAEHARGATWHLPFFACLDADGAVRWRHPWWVSDSLALRDGILYVAVAVGETAPSQLVLRAIDFATGEVILDHPVAVLDTYGPPDGHARFVQDGVGAAPDLRLQVRPARGAPLDVLVP